MTDLSAALTVSISLILLANVYAAIWRRLRLPTDPRRVWHFIAESWRQMPVEDQQTAAVLAGCVAVVVWVVM